MFKERMQK